MKTNIAAYTMREDIIAEYSEKRDSLAIDWWDWSNEMHLLPLPIPTLNEIYSDKINFKNIDILILTGGNDSIKANSDLSDFSERRNNWEFEMIKCALVNKTPILGVCRGMHILNLYFGGTLCKSLSQEIGSSEHAGQNHNIIIEDKFVDTFKNKIVNVNSYHNQGIFVSDLSNEFEMVASAEKVYKEKKIVEMIKHRDLPIYGIQWHPERSFPRMEIDKVILSILLKEYSID